MHRYRTDIRQPLTALVVGLAGVLLAACDPAFEQRLLPGVGAAEARQTSAWPAYGGVDGRKYVSAGQVNKENVGDLELAWVYRTGDVSTVFQSTPILVAGQLVFCTPYNRVVSLDPLSGGQLWTHDPQIDRSMRAANEFNCRGVAAWPQAKQVTAQTAAGACATRIFTATNDARLLALDALTGARCNEFGSAGAVDLSAGVGEIQWSGEYQVTSPPAVVGDVVVVGSAVSDGNRVEAPSGVVRGYDARNGALLWAFDLAPPDYDYRSKPVSEAGYALGTPNVWSAMTVDADRGLVFLPTGNPSPDYDRPANSDLNYYGSSVIALRAASGEVVWHFNTVINDLWDFDVPSQPVLADLQVGNEIVPVLIQSTKMGFVFVLHRETGEPVVQVDYRNVPVSGPLREQLSPVQPYPPEAFQVSRQYQEGGSLLGLCDSMDAESVIGPVYTPITEQWTVGLPSNMGATNWGGIAVDETRGLIAVHTNSVAFRTKLIKREESADLLDVMYDSSLPAATRQAARAAFYQRHDLPEDAEVAPQRGANYVMARHAYRDNLVGAPCAGLPMAEMMVIDIAAEQQLWRRAHGTVRDFVGMPLPWGVPGLGGPLITSSGLIFIGGAAEKAVRAYDVDNGAELWHHRLPHPANATPMSYTVATPDGEKQLLVIAAGGDARAGIGGEGDYMLAFKLPD